MLPGFLSQKDPITFIKGLSIMRGVTRTQISRVIAETIVHLLRIISRMISNYFPVDHNIYHPMQLLRGQYLMPKFVICFSIMCGHQSNITLQTLVGAIHAILQ